MMELVRFVAFFLVVFVAQSNGVSRFANYFQDHMVLQRAPQKSVIWGFGDPSQFTILWVNNKFYTTKSEAQPINQFGESIWSVTLDPETEEGPFQVLVTQPSANGTLVTIELQDVLFGDVWVCSGQSNMQMSVIDIFNASTEIANAGDFPKIRLFTAALKPSDTPVEELLGILENWSVASPASVGGPSFGYASAVCWLYGRMIHVALGGRPIGLVATSWYGTAIELWMPPKALQDCGISPSAEIALRPYGQPFEALSLNSSNLFNAMIYPFTRMVTNGALWYQGEANAEYNRDTYVCTFSKMIQYWRETWHVRTNGITDIQFPFGFVQLSTNEKTGTVVDGFPWIRWHQTFDIGYTPNNVVPKVFMAAAMDLRDDDGGIHPRTKADVAYRLSRSGLAVAYGQQVEFQGPIVSNVVVASDSKTVNITYTAVSNIELRNPNGFEVCCQGKKCSTDDTAWVASTVSSKAALTITLIVESSCVGKILYGLRYLWRETPCPFKQAAIYSFTDANLPAPPYIKIF